MSAQGQITDKRLQAWAEKIVCDLEFHGVGIEGRRGTAEGVVINQLRDFLKIVGSLTPSQGERD